MFNQNVTVRIKINITLIGWTCHKASYGSFMFMQIYPHTHTHICGLFSVCLPTAWLVSRVEALWLSPNAPIWVPKSAVWFWQFSFVSIFFCCCLWLLLCHSLSGLITLITYANVDRRMQIKVSLKNEFEKKNKIRNKGPVKWTTMESFCYVSEFDWQQNEMKTRLPKPRIGWYRCAMIVIISYTIIIIVIIVKWLPNKHEYEPDLIIGREWFVPADSLMVHI